MMLNTHFANLVKSYIPTIEQLTQCYAFAIPVENEDGTFGVDIELTDGSGIHELYGFYIDSDGLVGTTHENTGHRANVMNDICASLNNKVSGKEAPFTREDYFERSGLGKNIDVDTWISVEGLRFTKENISQPKVYIDMDGTLAVFNKNATMEEVFSPGYFRNLEPIPEMIEFAQELIERGYDVNILSGATYEALQEKIEWLQEHMPFLSSDHYVFVPVDADKSQFIPDPRHSILIDDYNKNLDAWKGLALKCKTDINSHNPKYTSLEVGTDMMITFLAEMEKMMPKQHIMLSDFLSLTHSVEDLKRPMVVCNDGFKLFIKAGEDAYCQPKLNLFSGDGYHEVEIAYPSASDKLLEDFAKEYLYSSENITDSIMPHVPVELVNQILESHGGIDAYRSFTPYDLIHFDLDNKWLCGELDIVLSPDGIDFMEKVQTPDNAHDCIENTMMPLIEEIIENAELPPEFSDITKYTFKDDFDFDKMRDLVEYINVMAFGGRMAALGKELEYRLNETEELFRIKTREEPSVER